MKNPLSDKEWTKLDAAIVWSERQLEFQKRKRLHAVQQMVGYHYAECGAERRNIVPMLALALQIYTRKLSPQNPRVLITAPGNDRLKPVAANFELAVNQIPDEIGLQGTLRRIVLEALFSIGVAKVGLYEVGHALDHKYGCPFVDCVPLDNYFLDMSAKCLEDICFEGNQYWLDYDELMDSDWIDEDEKKDLKPDEYTIVGVAGEPRVEGISADGSADQYHDRVHLRDIWLPKEGLVVTCGAETKKVLHVCEWDGPTCGPYYKLWFNDVPGNLMPLPPIALWRDLHELANTIFRKLGEEAESYKRVQGFQGGEEESVTNFSKARDGEGIRYTGSPPVQLEAGGVHAPTLAFYLQCRDLFSYFAGNLDTLGGLENQSPTLGQDKLLTASATAQMQDMADATQKFIQDIFHALAYYEWNDPVKKRNLEKPIPGTDATLPVKWNKKAKLGDFDDYDLKMDVYSLQDNSPNVRLQKLRMFMKEFVTPLEQRIQSAGGQVDYQEILKLAAKYSDFPELSDIVKFAETDQNLQTKQQGQDYGGDKTTARVGQPGMSRHGADSAMTQQLMGSGLKETAGAAPVTSGH
jgi:hypothetical protein